MKHPIVKIFAALLLCAAFSVLAFGLAWILFWIFRTPIVGIYEWFGWLPGNGLDDGIRMYLLSLYLLAAGSFGIIQCINYYYLRHKFKDNTIRIITGIFMNGVILNFLIVYTIILLGNNPPDWLIH